MLLQHDFRQPHAIGIARLAPRKIALVLVVPGKKGLLKRHTIYFINHKGLLEGIVLGCSHPCCAPPAIDPALDTRNNTLTAMDKFNRKVEDASARVSKTVADAAERLEKEIPEFVKYLNDEVVPAVRQHSTKALRTASEKLAEFADYMEQDERSRKP